MQCWTQNYTWYSLMMKFYIGQRMVNVNFDFFLNNISFENL